MGVFARLLILPALALFSIGLFGPAPRAVAAETVVLGKQLPRLQSLARRAEPRSSAPAETASVAPICDVFANGYEAVGAGPCASCFDHTKNFDETDIDCGGGTCSACAIGEQCNANADCATGDCDGATGVCVAAVCGNAVVEPGEACDDGNTFSETMCPYGQASCTACSATCSETLNLTGQYCGDGALDGADGEMCDDGNTVSETACPYGQPNCTQCNATCSETLNLTGPFCGDGALDGDNEVCDDGNNTDETTCPYGQPNCMQCNSTCSATLSLTGPYCGDGVKDPANEVCDDGNNVDETTCPVGQETCTACNSTCSMVLDLP
jgi:cysteine-rich repeat protein